MTADEFLDRYPEFDSEDSYSHVEKCVAETAGRIDATVFGARWDEAHGALTAHTLWASAFGVSLRLDGSGGEGSKYLDHFNLIKKAATTPLSMMVI